MGRTQALTCAAAIIAKHVPNLGDLILVLEAAGQLRLAGAIRNRMPPRAGGKVGGAAKPDPELWRRQAERVVQ